MCDFAFTGSNGLALAKSNPYDCIILDLMLPKVNGIQVCSTLREQNIHTPLLMLTACDTNAKQISGFNAGIDDYVIKPCVMPILWARLQAVAKRKIVQPTIRKVGDLVIDFTTRLATREDVPLTLTPTAWMILECIAVHSPAIVERKEIERYVWQDEEVEPTKLSVHIHHLRKALDKPFKTALVHTHKGLGLSLMWIPALTKHKLLSIW